MKRVAMAAAWAAAIVLGLFAGCESSDDGASSPVNVSGTWQGSSTGEDPANRDANITLILTQDGDRLAGTIDGVPLSGSVDGNRIASSFSGGEGDVVTLEGTVAGNTMGGTWISTTAENGTWTATRI